MITISKCLADPTRSRILAFIAQQDSTACLLIREQFDISQPTISHHLAKLVKADLVQMKKVGTEKYYSINKSVLRSYLQSLQKMYRTN